MAPHPKSETQTPGCPTPSPVNPVPAKIPVEEHHSHRHVLQLSLIVMVCMVGVMMFLCTVSLLIKFFYTRRYIRNHNRRRDAHAPILFDLNGDHDDDVEAQEVEVVHPIWHIRTVGLQQSLIDSITVFKYNKHEAGIIDGTECSVCLGEFEHDDTLRLLPKCSHAFHIPCIDTWLTSHKNCPLCRAPVVRDETLVRPTVDHTASNVSDHQSADAVSSAVEVEEETQPLRRSLSMDSTSANNSMLSFRDVVLDLDDDDSSGKDMNMSIEKHASTSTTINNKLGSIGRGLQQKRAGSMRRSFSQNTKFLFPRHSRSQSSTLPL